MTTEAARPLVEPLERAEVGELTGLFDTVETLNGYVPNSMLTMARVPGLTEAFTGLARNVLGPGRIEAPLKSLVSLVASTAAGCRYCQAHTSSAAEHRGADRAKIADAWAFETSPHFDERERAALRLARDAAVVPNAVNAEHAAALAAQFDAAEITELVAVVALFGFLNRWNDTMGTPLEQQPWGAAPGLLASLGWDPGKHAPPR
jgi:uncharacterized peroxidase-related enzyme